MFDLGLFIIPITALVAPLIGFLWYHPRAFGNVWVHLVNISPEALQNRAKKMPILALVAFLAALVMVYIFVSVLVVTSAQNSLQDALIVALAMWAGFIVPVLLGPTLWEGRPFKLFLINAGYWFVTLCTMAFAIVFIA